MSAVEALQRAPLFRGFSESGLETLAGIARLRSVPAGTPLFVEDAVGESLIVVVSGRVRLSRKAPGGGERDLGVLGPGSHLGELALLARTVRLISAVAATDCEVLELSRRDFFARAQEKPATCLKLAAAIAGELARRAAESKDALRELVVKG